MHLACVECMYSITTRKALEQASESTVHALHHKQDFLHVLLTKTQHFLTFPTHYQSFMKMNENFALSYRFPTCTKFSLPMI